VPETQLAAPLFIKEICETTVDTTKTPFFFNDGGAPTYLSQPPAGATPIEPAATRPALAMGNE